MSRVADPRGQLLVDRRHGGTCLAGAENGYQSRRTSLLALHIRNATQTVALLVKGHRAEIDRDQRLRFQDGTPWTARPPFAMSTLSWLL